MIRIAHLADSHFDEKNRLEDNIAVHRAFLEQANDADVDLILHAGDFFNQKSQPAERDALTDFLYQASRVAPVVGCKGNHDAEDDLNIFNRLERESPIIIADRPLNTVDHVDWFGAAGVEVIAVPWFTKAGVVASLPPGLSAAETTERTIAIARGLLSGFRIQAAAIAAHGKIPLLVGHLQVAGAETSTGQTLIGTTVELSPSDILEVGCAYNALGHIHKAQSWFDGRVAYSGSPQRHNFGEPEAKGWNLVTIDEERWREPDGVRVEFVELPARRMLLLEGDFPDVLNNQPVYLHEIPGSLVRVRYRIRPEDLHQVDEADIERRLRDCGAYDVKLEAILQHQDRVRCPEIIAASSTWEKVLALFASRGTVLPDATLQGLRTKLEQLEAAGVHHATV